MSQTSELLDRIDAEFRGAEAKIKQYQAEKVQEFESRQERLEQFVAVCDRLRDVWRPSLEALAQKFKDRVQVTPAISKSRRSTTFRFASQLAHFDLTFTVMTDAEVRHLVLDCTLNILPILMRFEKNSQLELPLDDVDPAVVGKWVDDRILDAVRTYLELHQNTNYLKRHLVSDPIAKVEFPSYAAGATLEWKGKTYYFIGNQTRDEFAQENKIPL